MALVGSWHHALCNHQGRCDQGDPAMKNILKSSLIILATSVMLAGCAGPSVRMGNATDQSQLDLSKGRTISASASGFQLLLLIPIAINGRQERAYQDLQAQAGDDAITN